MAYALVALGFVLALNAAGAVNFAHGDLVVLGGAVAVFAARSTGLPAPLLLPVVALAIGVVGILAARIAILPLASRPPEATFVATIALAAIVEQSLTIAMAGAPRTAPPLVGSGSFTIAGFVLGRQPLAIVVLGAAQYGGRPSPVLQARLDHALALWDEHRAPRIVFTGGRREGDVISEAAAGRRFALRRRVKSRIELRTRSSFSRTLTFSTKTKRASACVKM